MTNAKQDFINHSPKVSVHMLTGCTIYNHRLDGSLAEVDDDSQMDISVQEVDDSMFTSQALEMAWGYTYTN